MRAEIQKVIDGLSKWKFPREARATFSLPFWPARARVSPRFSLRIYCPKFRPCEWHLWGRTMWRPVRSWASRACDNTGIITQQWHSATAWHWTKAGERKEDREREREGGGGEEREKERMNAVWRTVMKLLPPLRDVNERSDGKMPRLWSYILSPSWKVLDYHSARPRMVTRRQPEKYITRSQTHPCSDTAARRLNMSSKLASRGKMRCCVLVNNSVNPAC